MQNISCLLAGGIFLSMRDKCPGLTVPFMFRAQVADSLWVVLAKFTHLVQRGRDGECLAHTGEIYPGLLVPAEHNSPQLHLVL